MKVMLQNLLNVTGSNSYSGCHKCRMGFTLDTEQNREIIQKYLAHKTPTTGRSDSIDEAAGRRCTIKSKEELLIEEANALDSLFMSMKSKISVLK